MQLMRININIWSVLITTIFLSNALAFRFNNINIKFDFLFSVILLLSLLFRFKCELNRKLLIFVLFLINGLITSFVYKINTYGVLINFFLILFFGTLLWNLFKFASYENLLKYYKRAAKLCVYFGIIQILAFFININYPNIFFVNLYDPRLLFVSSPISYAGIYPKISSFFTEPSYLACFLMPFLIISFNNRKKYISDYFMLFSVLLVFTFTFSSIGFIALFIYFLSVSFTFNLKKTLPSIFFLVLIIFFILINDSMYTRVIQLGQSDIDSVNLTTLGYLVNLNYINTSLNWHYFFGYGLDSYQIILGQMHDRLQTSSNILQFEKSELMLNGAPTLFFRIFVEYGIIGYLIIVNKFKYEYLKSPFFFGFLAFCFRSGEYLRFDTLFFLFMFLFFHDRKVTFSSNNVVNNNCI